MYPCKSATMSIMKPNHNLSKNKLSKSNLSLQRKKLRVNHQKRKKLRNPKKLLKIPNVFHKNRITITLTENNEKANFKKN